MISPVFIQQNFRAEDFFIETLIYDIFPLGEGIFFMKQQNKKFYIGLVIVLFFFAFFLISSSDKESQISNSVISPIAAIKKTESATILAGNKKTYLSFSSNALLYDVLVQEKNAGKIIFSGKNYPGLGFFVTDIDSLHSGNGKDLLYYINGKEASVGISTYILKDGDIIEWKLE